MKDNKINDSDFLSTSFSHSRILTDKIILFISAVFFFDLSCLIIDIFSHENDIFIIFFLASALFLTDSDIKSDELKIFLFSLLKNLMKNSVKNSMKNLMKKIKL